MADAVVHQVVAERWERAAGRAYPRELRERAARMRREGIGRATIARSLGVAASAVGRWFREGGVELVSDGLTGRAAWLAAQRRTVDERWAHQDAEQAAHAAAVGPLTERELLLVGAAIYWAEGAKAKPWRHSQRMIFVNSDPGMVAVHLEDLRLRGVPRTALTCRVQIHESADVVAAERWWRARVGHDLHFGRAALKRHNPTTTRQNTGDAYVGCLAVSVRDSAQYYRSVAGTWDGVVAAVMRRSPVV